MGRSLTEGLIAELRDIGSLSEPIVWRPESIASARELLANVGAWQSAPDTGDAILLGDQASVTIYVDSPPWRIDDDLTERIQDLPRHVVFSIGIRGGIKREAV